MTKEVISKLGHNLLMELKRKDYTKEERQEIINQFMKSNKLTYRAIEKLYGISLSTLHHWLNPERKAEIKAQSYKVSGKRVQEQLNEIDKITAAYVDEIDKYNFKINDYCREKIEELKDRWNYIYMKTRKVIVD